MHFAPQTSTSFHCEIESAWEGASRHQSVDGLCHFCCDSPHPSRAVSAGAACGAGSISQCILAFLSQKKLMGTSTPRSSRVSRVLHFGRFRKLLSLVLV